MTQQQLTIVLVLAATMAMFLWARWRHDMVAVGALLACVLLGLVPAQDAFLGFGHPAVITVACVLILSHGLQASGAIDAIAQACLPQACGPLLTIAVLTTLGAVLSAFMNNVGALALLMPLAIQRAGKHGMPSGQVLMPLAFGTILGGMVTMIGTPPNLIVAGFREQIGAGSFLMFDFTPVGLAVASAGVAFIALLGWRMVPLREHSNAAGFDTGKYFTEVRVARDSKAAGKPLHEVEQMFDEADAQIVGMVRNEVRLMAPNPRRRLRVDDIIVLEAEPKALASTLSALGLQLEDAHAQGGNASAEAPPGAVPHARHATPPEDERRSGARDRRDADQEVPDSGDVVIQELVVTTNSSITGRSARELALSTRYGINLLAISRQGSRSIRRLHTSRFAAGDVLLMQGSPEALSGFAADCGCLPLAARAIRIPDPRASVIATLVMLCAIGAAAFGLLPAAISFAAGALALMALRIVSLRKVYEAIDWPVVVLLAALIPVAGAMAHTGAADVLASTLLETLAGKQPVIALALIFVVTMTLSDFMNNAATAAVMCPIAISTAEQLGANPDAFLMAVAVSASCAFLTPIGHQNNTLILGPGGFRFGDYWRLGLPLELLVIAVSIPMLLWVWPL